MLAGKSLKFRTQLQDVVLKLGASFEEFILPIKYQGNQGKYRS